MIDYQIFKYFSDRLLTIQIFVVEKPERLPFYGA